MSNKLMELVKMEDVEFYDRYVSDAPLKEQARFFEEFPEFMQVSEPDKRIGEELQKIYVEIVKAHTTA